jgi:hypothetical protein
MLHQAVQDVSRGEFAALYLEAQPQFHAQADIHGTIHQQVLQELRKVNE